MDDEGKVVPIKPRTKKEIKRQQDEDAKTRKAQYKMDIIQEMCGRFYGKCTIPPQMLNVYAHPFNERLCKHVDNRGEPSFFEVDEDNVARLVSETYVITSITKYVNDQEWGYRNNFKPTFIDDVKSIFSTWCGLAPELSYYPKSVALKEDPSYCFYRLPWSLNTPAKLEGCELFSELLGRCNNSEALLAWIGSLFVPEAYRQQYVWMYGEGMNGKGTLMRLLYKALGHKAAMFTEAPAGSDKFWASTLVGKRLIMFEDCNHYGFPMTGLFKTLTGNDTIRSELKGKDSVNVPFDGMFMFASNEVPAISSQKSDTRRCIFVEMQAIEKEPDPWYEAQLWQELPKFLAAAVAFYLEKCPERGMIKVDGAVTDELAATNEEWLDAFCQQNFIIDQGPAHLLEHERPFMTGIQLQWLFKEEHIDKRQERNIRAYLKRKFSIYRPKTVRISSTKYQDRYVGIKIKKSGPYVSPHIENVGSNENS